MKNKIGALSVLTAILAGHGINIEKLIQKEETESGMEIVLLSSDIEPFKIEGIVNQLNNLDIVNNSVIPLV